MSDLKELTKQRGSVRARLTLFEKYLTPLLEVTTEHVNKIQINELSLRLSKAQELSYTFDQVQTQIERLDSDEDTQMLEREVTENRFFSLIAQAQQLLESWKSPECVSSEEVSNCNGSRSNHNNLKLPSLKIPTFDGNSSKWLEFRDMFLSLIHNNDKIDDVNKFHYLKSFLSGSSSVVISSVTVSAKNYEVAWSLLCERYDNKRLLINEHLKGLFSIEPLVKESDRGIRTLIDVLSKNLCALGSLGEPTDKWDTLIIYIASSKLDAVTLSKWEEFRSNKDSPTLEDFYSFLRLRANILETVSVGKISTSPRNKNDKRQSFSNSKSFTTSSVTPIHYKCIFCTQDHKLHECSKFKSLPLEERNTKVYQWRVCANCLRGGHQSYQCRLSGCKFCKRKHNTLLHKQQAPPHHYLHSTHDTTYQQCDSSDVPTTSTGGTKTTTKENESTTTTNMDPCQKAFYSTSSIAMSAATSCETLLSTALVEVVNKDKVFILRALLDSGSQFSFISEAALNKVGYDRFQNSLQCVSGLSNNIVNVTEHCDLKLRSLHKSFSASVKCYILPFITDKLPQSVTCINNFNIPSNIRLADPMFNYPSDIDLLLGADIFWELMNPGRLRLGARNPILQETELGWIVAGPFAVNIDSKPKRIQCNFSQEIKQQLSKFWELEELPPKKYESAEKNYCEKLFKETTCRDNNGRFIVQIPLRQSAELLGESYNMAKQRLHQLERKMSKQPSFKFEYSKFIHEYQALGHLNEVPRPEFGCYLPHHAVIKEKSETTKLRVVFDASSKTTTGISFNDIQYVGPVVQDDLFSILLRFRKHKYVVTGDVEKMYRQILVHEAQRHLQMILWRDNESMPIKTFQLNTVTYGTASAPFLSTRCLVELSKECLDPKIAQLIREDFYIDDFLSGGSTKEELKEIIHSVTSVLNSACFHLRKFRTNAPSVFENNPDASIPKNLDLCSQSSALGLAWDPRNDVFKFTVDIKSPIHSTKRSILSSSAKLFDPLGLLGLCTIIPKTLLQKLWLTKLDWDDPVPAEIETSWNQFITGLKALATIEIPRCVFVDSPATFEIHSFSDASEIAYAACIYIRSTNSVNETLIKLLCAKTKVAPLKSVSIPRLELCAAHLAAQLCSKVIKALRCDVSKIVFWTDSSVVLSWLSSQPSELQTFVANRVSDIQRLTSPQSWRHVSGKDNPADLASRGLDPRYMNRVQLWWNGPSFLQLNPDQWPQNITVTAEVPERKSKSKGSKTITCITINESTMATLHNNTNKLQMKETIIEYNRFSSLTKLQRTTAYCMRFINNLQNSNIKTFGPLTCSELDAALEMLIKLHQIECFSNELEILSNKRDVPNNSRILSLNPFIDKGGILRVGGRIQNSLENYSKKHPALLESSHSLTKLLFIHQHKTLFHCGPQLLLSTLRERYWPLRGRILARSTVNNCVLCRILRAKTINPIMGNLPAPRVTPALPFQISGVDFAGPFLITDRRGRGCRISKCYLCLFVCLATKALHLELASDLSTDIFILCLRRFVSRRGKPSILYCDNGTNFVGANNEIRKFLRSNKDDVVSWAAGDGIDFKFSPAYAPHFGGLWEAGVKAAKFHMTRILANQHLTFEELSTLFIQIEAILNSRPLTPLSSDPNDLQPLTPGHFLIGRALVSLPSPPLLDVKTNRLDRYQHLEQLRQFFWNRWRHEYLCEMQQRSKWKTNQDGLQEDDLVILKEANLPPLKWRMGRIIKLHPGADDVARVADVKTAKGVIRRAINQLCPLFPTSSNYVLLTNPDVFEGGEDV